MRLTGRDCGYRITTTPDSDTPIRLKLAGLAFALTTDEARDLATALADTITQLKT